MTAVELCDFCHHADHYETGRCLAALEDVDGTEGPCGCELCPNCGGSGWLNGIGRDGEDCATCDGRGTL